MAREPPWVRPRLRERRGERGRRAGERRERWDMGSHFASSTFLTSTVFAFSSQTWMETPINASFASASVKPW